MANTTPLLERGIHREFVGSKQPVLSGPNECCNTAATCEDSLSILDSASITGIVVTRANGDGAVTLTFAAAIGATAVVAAIKAALAPYEFNVFVDGSTRVDGTHYLLRHQGQDTLTTITGAGNTARLCTVRIRCDFDGSINGTTTAIVVNGTSRAFGASVIYGTTSAATAQTTIQTAVDLGSIAGGATVTVVNNAVTSKFDINISARQGTTFAIGAVNFQENSCKQVFEA